MAAAPSQSGDTPTATSASILWKDIYWDSKQKLTHVLSFPSQRDEAAVSPSLLSVFLTFPSSTTKANAAHISAVGKLWEQNQHVFKQLKYLPALEAQGETGRVRWNAEQGLAEQVRVEWMLKRAAVLSLW